MKQKTAIIISGGGMGASYGVGCILALVKEFGLTNPDVVIAGSGSTGTMSYFVSRQYNGIKNIRSNLLSTKKFINFRRFRKIIDIDYLIDEVFKKQDPLDISKIYSSEIEYLISVTNAKTGNIEYLSNHSQIDLFEAMRASKAMPLFFGKKVKIGQKVYFDSPNSTSTELKIQKAIDLGVKKIIIIDSGKKTPKRLLKYYCDFKSEQFKKNFWREYNQRFEYTIPDNIKCIWLKPEKKLTIGLLENSQKKLKETIQKGYEETKNNKDLKSFLT